MVKFWRGKGGTRKEECYAEDQEQKELKVREALEMVRETTYMQGELVMDQTTVVANHEVFGFENLIANMSLLSLMVVLRNMKGMGPVSSVVAFGFALLLEASSSQEKELLLCQPDPVCSAGPPDGTLYEPVKPAKLDATALHDCTLAGTVPPSEPSHHAVPACNTGIHEEHYVSEGVEDDVPDCREYRDACTITDVCNSTNLPEVEIISLLEEQLPHYKLRADTIYGYDHDDWLHTPLISPDANIDLTTEQIEETLKYFRRVENVLRAAMRVSPGGIGCQVNVIQQCAFAAKKANCILGYIKRGVVSRQLAHSDGNGNVCALKILLCTCCIERVPVLGLLADNLATHFSGLQVFSSLYAYPKVNKERDLELAARIGQSLLKKNKSLTERNDFLEEQVEHIREEVSQLRHELSMKDELLQFYTSAAEESEPESVCSTPLKRNESSSSVQNYFHLDSLQKKLKDLEEENVVLRSEACQLKTETITYEEKEQQLVNDCVKELRDANIQIANISEELAKKTEDAARQQEEITHLLSQIVDLQKKAKACAVENEELVQHLGAAKDAQRQLTAELRELEDKYAECMEMLHEAQEELKNLRNKTMPNAISRRYHSLGLFPMDSLAAEIEGSMRKELHLDEPDSPDLAHQKRVFETVRNVNQVVKQRSMTPSPMNIPGSNQSSAMNSVISSCVSTPRSSFYGGDISNIMIDNKTNSIILETESSDNGNEDRMKKPGTPGTPGSSDLETALRRLSLRRENYLSERKFFEEEQERKLRELAEKGELHSGSVTPTESIMSLGTHSRFSEFTGYSGMSISSRSYLPEKLQIVKPLEGSATLHHWQQLAQPHLGGILDPRPGVVTKGFRTLDLDLDEVYCLNDYEEDETGDISYKGLTTSTPVQHTETSGERSQAQVTVSDNKNKPRHSQAFTEEMQESTTDDDEGSVPHPGKCMSQTNSTFTFTTCRILHPSDELTRVTPSLNAAPTPACGSISNLKGTPVATPCTPRRLSLAESFTNLRESTTTMSTSLGLVWLLKERGISAAVYNPQSWDRASRSTLLNTYSPKMAIIPSTPPNSPMQTPSSSPPSFEFKCTSPPYDNFLASKPASSILKEVRNKKNIRNSESQTDVSVSNLNLVDKVKRFGIAKVVSSGQTSAPPLTDDQGPLLCGAQGPVRALVSGGLAPDGLPLGCPAVTSAIGAIQLNTGIRRNRSFPTMVGSSMQMKGPAALTSGILMGTKLPKQTSLR
ncbi:trafficking kinesin-binding protein 1 isoform X4 [Willisornis vidua]|uniref:Trafficking kinesin-binding protein 1 isoform X4 n=1 Tax=Willisornis vidua TaxID=1566151 RepID=A0ABQ9CQA0_9PASS|nr:trafficking kinesin-binding protein 1 isoform X4 [Willisornis vidua]